MVKVSVIIPVYNTLDYIGQCIDSVLNQTLDDIEVICVNDGSTDGSLDILDRYQNNDSRFKLISQENKGLAASRNVALEMVEGEYVLFLDSDDYLDLNALEYIYNLSNDKNLDMLFFKIMNFNNNTGRMSRSPYFDMDFLKKTVQDNVFSWEDIRDCIFDVSVTAASKLFKSELIEDIRFPEGLIFEDNLFFMKTLFHSNRIFFADKYFYYRRIRSDSITNSYHGQFSDCIDIYELIIEFFKEIGKYDEFHVQIFDRQCFDYFHRFRQLDDDFKQDFYFKMKNQFLKHNACLKSMETLDNCHKRSLEIYNRAIDSHGYEEFELAIEYYDLKVKNSQYKKSISKLTREIEEIKNSNSWRLTGFLRNIKK